MAAYYPVFIDTSLDTHLIIVISNFDTTSDLKRKTEKEHPLCFPATGKIAVQAVKVKCNGRHYCLPDSFLVNFAFRGVLENWVLSLDVSTLEEHDGNQRPRRLLTFGGIPNNNYVDIVEHSLNGCTRQGVHSGKRTEVSEKLAIIKNDMSKHDSVLQCNMLEGKNIMENSACNVATLKMEITSELPLHDNEKIENLPSDGLCIKLVDDVHNSENRRKKKKRRKQHNVESPTSVKEVREEDVAMTILNNNNAIKPSIESDLRCCDLGQRLSEVHRINVEAKHCDSMQEVGRPNTEPSAIDADITKSDAGKVQGGYTGNAKHQCVFGVEVNPSLNAKVPNNLQMITELSGLKNISTVQIQQVEEERALLQKNDSEKMQPKQFKPPSKGEIEVNSLMVTLDLLDQDGTVEPKNSSKKRKKTKNSVRRTLFSSDRDNAKCSESENPSVEPQKTLYREYPSDKTKTSESKFSARNCEVMKTNTEHIVVQKDAIVGHEFVFLQNISVTEANTENRDESLRKKQTPLAQISNYLKAEDKSLHQNSMIEANGKREVLFASSLSQSKILGEPALIEQENGPGLECGVRTSVPTELDLELGKPTIIQSDTLGNTYERMPARVDLNGITPSTSCQYVANNSTGSSTKGSKINSQKHIPNLCQHGDDASVELIANKNYKNKADNEVDSSQKIKLMQTNASNTEEIVRRKSKQKSLAENCTNVEAEDHNVVHQNKILETNDNRVVTLSSQSKSKILKKPVSKDHLNGIGLESENIRVQSYPVPAHSNKECGKPTNLQLEAVGNSLGYLNCNAHTPIVGSEDKAQNPADSSGESSSINFKKYFLKQQCHEVDAPGEVLIDRSNRNSADNDPKVIKKKNRNDSLTSGNSPALLVSLKSNHKQGIGGKLQLESSSPISPQGSFVRGDFVDFEILCEKFPKTSRQETRPLLSGMSSKLDSNPEEAKNNNVGNDSVVNAHSERKGETFTLVNSNLEKSRNTACQNSTSYKHPSQLYHKWNVVPSGKNNRKAANSSDGRINSSAVPTSILSGYVSEKSEDGTKTPSDYSAFPHSDGESNSICTSPVGGSSTLETKRTGGRSKKSSFSSRAKYLTLDTILRSSIRYKRARFRASQSHQEDDSKKLVL